MENLTQAIDEQLESVNAYAKTHFGMKCGDDFPAFALALIGSKKFTDLLTSATLIGGLNMMLMPKKPEGATEMPKELLDKFIEESMLRKPLAELFYAGYKLGIAQTERKHLEELAAK